MKINEIQNNNIGFGIKVSRKIYTQAKNFYWGVNYCEEQFGNFKKRAKYITDTFGHDNYTLITGKVFENGKPMMTLSALKDGDSIDNAILISKKDKFRKILDKLMHIKKHELDLKLNG